MVLIDSYWYGTEVLGILFFLNWIAILYFTYFRFRLLQQSLVVTKKIYWLNAVNCLGAKPSQEKSRKVDYKLILAYMCAPSG